MIGYNPSHLNTNETLLEAFHRVEAYLKANPQYQVYQSSAQYQEGTQEYALNTIIVPEGSTVGAGDVVLFSNVYYAVITSVSETTFSIATATNFRGTDGTNGKDGTDGKDGTNGKDGEQGVGVKSITSGTPTVVNDKTNTPITITLTDNTTVDLVVSAENGKDGTSGTVDIVQATGQSESAVMSQKAVTDELNKKANTSEVNAKYTKPSGGIPKSDLAVSVQTSLDKADTALQSAPVTSVNGKTGAVQLAAEDVGALPSSTKFVSSVNGQSGDVTGLATKEEVNAKQNALTETQLAAVDSGITEAKRTKYDGYEVIINQKANASDLAAVATSGSYNDLSNIPVINQDLTNFMPVGGTYYRHIGASSDTFRNDTIYLYDGTRYISLRDIPTLQSFVVGLQQQVNNLQGQISGNESGSVSVILASSDWVADSTISPFTVKATKTLSSETGGAVVMGQFDAISLAYFTTEAVKARSAGMCIGAVPQASGSEITFYAVTAPTEQIQAIVIITPTRITD